MAEQPSSAIVPLEDIDPTDRGGAGSSGSGREYRKGNWTIQETMILIAAKKLDDERRLKGGEKEKGKSAEFRWKWVENYCWKNGCQRSQNQCNDKWDNLLRDYKKVRDYGSKMQAGPKTYWQLEKHERKERGLPSNMIIQVYDALHEVIDKRPPTALTISPRPPPPPPPPPPLPSPPPPPLSQSQSHLLQQLHIPQQQHVGSVHQHHQQQQQQQTQAGLFLPGPSLTHVLPPPLPPPPPPQIQQHYPPQPPPQSAEVSTESEGSGTHARSPKRRKTTNEEGLAPTVSKSTYEITQTLLACEEKKEKRHRDLLGVEERKLHLEETKTEISRQGIQGLIGAVNNLANAILTLASSSSSDRHTHEH